MHKKSTKNDIYIESLKYGKEKLANFEDFTRDELRKYLIDKGYSLSQKSPTHIIDFKDAAFESLFGRVFAFSKNPDTGNQRFWLNLEGYFQLLEHEELKDARKSSNRAMIVSIVAIIISITTLIVSIHYSQLALNEPITINNSQLEELTQTQFDYNKIDEIIELLESQKKRQK